ncbi:hypothetical protein [Flavobacterium sp. GSP6]|uniref:hypothetical protein n=1 Tax=Flavobacterium sp. GSP6 TaxID=2497488 RepID=UPI000F868209|nr:hypothetical protein [Flavobacterium sp. GSP6]RTZ03094.1 hypothetical protein EKM03_13385 [Flavobacterium sp. GSP6]
MEIKFDVRIGKIRKNQISEMILKQNVGFLKSGIHSLLKDINSETKKIGIVIPGKGHSIKMALEDVKEKHVRKELKSNFPFNIYKGKYSAILDNIDNQIFDGY